MFGSFDGATSLIGVLAGELVVHAALKTIVASVLCYAVAAGLSMGGGDYVSGTKLRASVVMAVATFLGSLIPALPAFLIPGFWGVIISGVILLMLGLVIAEVRSADLGRRRAYFTTLTILVSVSVLSVVVAVAIGAV